MISNNTIHKIAHATWFVDNYPCALRIDSQDNWPAEFQEKSGLHVFDRFLVHEIHDVDLCGPAMVGFKDGDVILDTAYANRLDVLDRNKPYYMLALKSMAKPGYVIEDPLFPMVGVWSGNYFHWIIEWLPKLEGILHYEAMTNQKVVILLEENPPQWQYDSLRFLLGAERSIISLRHLPTTSMHIGAKNLVLPTIRRSNGRTDPTALDWLRRTVWEQALLLTLPKNYFISRELAQGRHIVNESRIWKEVWPVEIERIQPETMPWIDQVNAFVNADFIIGPHGSGLVNSVFSWDPKIIELYTPDYANPCIMTMAMAIGADYRGICCTPVGKNMEVDLGELRTTIEEMR